MIKMVIEKAYAKLNLSLSVLGKMDNGFHEIESIMVPINLYDTLYFKKNNTNKMILLNNDIVDNSILKAAELFQETYKTSGATILLDKRIPLEAGLAGGSADSSATLRGLNRLFKLNRPLEELAELAMKLGSDNKFCLYNQAAICRGRGEKLEFLDFNFKFNVMLIKPKFGLSTKEVFQNITLKSKRCNKSLLDGLKNNNYEIVDKNIYNDLLEGAISLKPELKELIDEIKLKGVLPHMSGSGSTLFVLGNKKGLLKELVKNEKIGFLAKTTIKKRFYHCFKSL